MITAEVVLRIIAALLEARVIELQHAPPDQIQSIVERHEKRLAGFEKVLRKILPDFE